MTIGAWTVAITTFILIAGFGVAFIWAGWDDKEFKFIAAGVGMIVLAIVVSCSFVWYRSVSATGRRALKDQQINLQSGVERTVRVFDINGNQIEEYSGKFDIETDRNSYILFDDEYGKRHMIYYTTGTIIVDEK